MLGHWTNEKWPYEALQCFMRPSKALSGFIRQVKACPTLSSLKVVLDLGVENIGYHDLKVLEKTIIFNYSKFKNHGTWRRCGNFRFRRVNFIRL